MADHPNKHIREAIRYAEAKGWTVTKAGPRAHVWGVLWCPQSSRDGCRIRVMSTPRNPERHARDVRRDVDRCPQATGSDRCLRGCFAEEETRWETIVSSTPTQVKVATRPVAPVVFRLRHGWSSAGIRQHAAHWMYNALIGQVTYYPGGRGGPLVRIADYTSK